MKAVLPITNNDEKIIKAVDYVTRCLVTDVVDMMQTIIEDFAEDPTERSRLAILVNLGKTFIKQQLDRHVIKENMVITRGLEYALTNSAKNVPIKGGDCNGCNFLPWVVSQIKGTVRRSAFGGADVQQDAWDVLEVCRDKLEIYTGHRSRVKNQQNHYDKILDDMHDRCLQNKGSTELFTLIDLKMKSDPISSRETTHEHYGHCSMGWHGCISMYFDYKEWEEEYDNREMIQNHGAIRHIVYGDQILEEENKQDSPCVYSMVVAYLYAIKERLPHTKTTVLASDNAGCYS